jgi:hypothetical protein
MNIVSKLDHFIPIIWKMHADGHSHREIAKTIGFSPENTSYYLRKRGFKTNPRRYHDFFQGLFSQHQKDVLLGTLLGDAHLDLTSSDEQINPRLQFGHGPEQYEYLMWKVAQFGELFKEKTPRKYFSEGGNAEHYLIHSRCHPLLKEYYNQLFIRPDAECNEHVHKKMVTTTIFDQVTDKALAIWWCDDGTYENTGIPVLVLGALTEDEYCLIMNWASERWHVTRWNHPTRNSIRLRLPTPANFVSRIAPHVPKCMYYKFLKLKGAAEAIRSISEVS